MNANKFLMLRYQEKLFLNKLDVVLFINKCIVEEGIYNISELRTKIETEFSEKYQEFINKYELMKDEFLFNTMDDFDFVKILEEDFNYKIKELSTCVIDSSNLPEKT